MTRTHRPEDLPGTTIDLAGRGETAGFCLVSVPQGDVVQFGLSMGGNLLLWDLNWLGSQAIGSHLYEAAQEHAGPSRKTDHASVRDGFVLFGVERWFDEGGPLVGLSMHMDSIRCITWTLTPACAEKIGFALIEATARLQTGGDSRGH